MSNEGVSAASSIIGFISFATSLATLTRVLWNELTTLFDAPNQVHFSLSNLKEALFEEYEAVKRVSRVERRKNRRRRSTGSGNHGPSEKGHQRASESGDIVGMDPRIMQESIRQLCDRFAAVERPFLRLVGPSNEWDDAETATRYNDSGFENDYCDMTLGLRMRWLRTKGEVSSLWTILNRFQLRRIAREVTITLIEGRALDRNLRDLKLISDHEHDSENTDLEGPPRVHIRRKRSRRSEGGRSHAGAE